VPGSGFRFKVPPDQAGDPKILLHRILLPAGLFLLGFGLWAGGRFLHTHPPADADLHAVHLQAVLSVTEIHDSYQTNEIEAVELHAADHRIIRYDVFCPRFDEVRKRDTRLTILVDSTNQVWLVKSAGGQVFGRDYFLRRNMEAKAADGLCAILFIPLGTLMFLPALALEYGLRRDGKLPKDGAPVSARKFTLAAGLLGYLYIFGFAISPWLSKMLPNMVVILVWLFSGAGLIKAILWYFEPKRRKSADANDASRPVGPPEHGG